MAVQHLRKQRRSCAEKADSPVHVVDQQGRDRETIPGKGAELRECTRLHQVIINAARLDGINQIHYRKTRADGFVLKKVANMPRFFYLMYPRSIRLISFHRRMTKSTSMKRTLLDHSKMLEFLSRRLPHLRLEMRKLLLESKNSTMVCAIFETIINTAGANASVLWKGAKLANKMKC